MKHLGDITKIHGNEIEMTDILLQSNGKPWLTDEDKTVPKNCPVCGADMGLFLRGEPVFLCKSAEEHYYGTLKYTEGE